MKGHAQPGTTPDTDAGPRPTDPVRERAARVVADLAERLTDPVRVSMVAGAPGNVDELPDMAPRPVWSPTALAAGHCGIALLFTELAGRTPAYRSTAHAHLAAATEAFTGAPFGGLSAGTASLAFAACAARRAPGDYATLLDRLDERVAADTERLLTTEEARLRAGAAGVSMHDYDVISGAAGLGRYLLLREPLHHGLLTRLLAYLVRLTEPVRAHGHTVPGWWCPGPPGLVRNGEEFAHGHFNLGLSHGIPGPLALMSLALRAGVRVPGQEAAIETICDWLLSSRAEDGQWPAQVTFPWQTGDRTRPLTPGRLAWCYGTPGVAAALHLAGAAMGRADWQQPAVDALADALAGALAGDAAASAMAGDAPANGPGGAARPGDSYLCHGWSGVLHTTWRLARASGDQRLAAHLPELAARVLDGYDPDTPFGYRSPPPPPRRAPDRPGFLEGTAGIALALNAYAHDEEQGPWEAVLLLA